MTKEEITQKKKHGDLKTVGAILGISEQNAYVALKREGSKYHNEVINILERVIEMRERLSQEVNAIEI